MIQKAKNLIAKGRQLNDDELIQMGIDLLEQYDDKKPINNDPIYKCQSCGHEMPVDKEGRKRCPKCKKHKLEIKNPPPNKNFIANIRDDKTRGGKIVFQNTWTDDKTECFDEQDAALKKITHPSQRFRPPAKKIKVKCENCGKIEEIHPIHAPTGESRSFYMCPKCIKNRKAI